MFLLSLFFSGDCFVLLTPSTAFQWIGNGSNADERAVCERVAREVLAGDKRGVEVAVEGQEPEAFWAALTGGKGEYANEKHLQSLPAEPRLFQVSGVTLVACCCCSVCCCLCFWLNSVISFSMLVSFCVSG
jgi:hypothetical protein